MRAIDRALQLEASPAEILRIRQAIGILGERLSDYEAEAVWRAFSRDYSANFLRVDDEWLERFKDWM